MNITELRDELGARAAGIEADPSLASVVAGKIRLAGRRRATAAVGAAGALAVLAGIGAGNAGWPDAPALPAQSGVSTRSTSADGMPARVLPDSPGDLVRDGLRYRASIAGDTRVAGVIGAEGQGSMRLTWTPATTRVRLLADCWLPGADPQTISAIELRMTRDGIERLSTKCNAQASAAGDLPESSVTPGEPGEGWTDLRVGTPTSVTVELVDRGTGKPVSPKGARVVGAVYALGAQRSIVDPATRKTVVALPEVLEHHGHRYRLSGDVATAPAASGKDLTVRTPQNVPFLVTWGSAGTGVATDGSSLGTDHLTGLATPTTRNSSGGWSTIPQPARGPGMATVRHEGDRPTQGVTLLAVYTLAT